MIQIKEKPKKTIAVLSDEFQIDSSTIVLFRPNNVLGSGLCYPISFNDEFIGGLYNGDIIKFRKLISNDENNIKIQYYDEIFKFPVVKPVVRIKVGKMGRPKVDFFTSLKDLPALEKEKSP